MLVHWYNKFAYAFRGLYWGVVGQTSFAVHLSLALAVVLAAWALQCQVWQWCLLVLCIGLVLALELVNSALECLARGLCQEHNPQVGRALDIAAGAVLVASLTSAAVGLTVLAMQL